MYFLYSAQVVAAIVRSVPRASAGLSRLAASPVPAAPPAPISVCASSMNRMIGFGEACTSSITWRSRCSNSPFMLAPACSRPTSSVRRRDVLQLRRHVAARRCAARSPRRPRSCRRRPRRSGSGCSAGGASGCRRSGGSPRRGRSTGSISPLRALLGQVDRESLAAPPACPSAAGAIAPLASPGRRPRRCRRVARQRRFRRAGQHAGEIVGQRVRLDLARTAARCANSALRSVGVFSMPTSRWPVRTWLIAEHQRAEHPGALDRLLDLRREVGDRGRAARQPVERGGHVGGQARRVDLVVLDDAVQVGVLRVAGSGAASAPARHTGCRAACRTRSRPRSPGSRPGSACRTGRRG